MATSLYSCRGCRDFYDTKLKACPKCGRGKVPANAALANSRWTSNLNAQAEHAVKYG